MLPVFPKLADVFAALADKGSSERERKGPNALQASAFPSQLVTSDITVRIQDSK